MVVLWPVSDGGLVIAGLATWSRLSVESDGPPLAADFLSDVGNQLVAPHIRWTSGSPGARAGQPA
jgi:hypothetical protein